MRFIFYYLNKIRLLLFKLFWLGRRNEIKKQFLGK